MSANCTTWWCGILSLDVSYANCGYSRESFCYIPDLIQRWLYSDRLLYSIVVLLNLAYTVNPVFCCQQKNESNCTLMCLKNKASPLPTVFFSQSPALTYCSARWTWTALGGGTGGAGPLTPVWQGLLAFLLEEMHEALMTSANFEAPRSQRLHSVFCVDLLTTATISVVFKVNQKAGTRAVTAV